MTVVGAIRSHRCPKNSAKGAGVIRTRSISESLTFALAQSRTATANAINSIGPFNNVREGASDWRERHYPARTTIYNLVSHCFSVVHLNRKNQRRPPFTKSLIVSSFNWRNGHAVVVGRPHLAVLINRDVELCHFSESCSEGEPRWKSQGAAKQKSPLTTTNRAALDRI